MTLPLLVCFLSKRTQIHNTLVSCDFTFCAACENARLFDIAGASELRPEDTAMRGQTQAEQKSGMGREGHRSPPPVAVALFKPDAHVVNLNQQPR